MKIKFRTEHNILYGVFFFWRKYYCIYYWTEYNYQVDYRLFYYEVMLTTSKSTSAVCGGDGHPVMNDTYLYSVRGTSSDVQVVMSNNANMAVVWSLFVVPWFVVLRARQGCMYCAKRTTTTSYANTKTPASPIIIIYNNMRWTGQPTWLLRDDWLVKNPHHALLYDEYFYVIACVPIWQEETLRPFSDDGFVFLFFFLISRFRNRWNQPSIIRLIILRHPVLRMPHDEMRAFRRRRRHNPPANKHKEGSSINGWQVVHKAAFFYE